MADTIFALATPPARSAIAVVRLSGSQTGSALATLAGALPPPRQASLRRLHDPVTQETIDRALVLWFPAPASYTGEDAAELHLHGGLAVIDATAEALLELGLRAAEPGEFTRRAFENQRLDLTEAEAVADLIDAQTAAQRRQALSQLEGALASAAAGWRRDLLEALAYLEAAVDFPDEALPREVMQSARPSLERVSAALADAASDRRGEQVRQGFRVALLGAPNAGKSSLINALLGRDAAIVSPIAGTTRDVVEAAIVLRGHSVVLADTAGLRPQTDDPIEREGMRRARAWAEGADLRLHLVAPDDEAPAFGMTGNDVVVHSKADLLAATQDGLSVSVRSGVGLGGLADLIATRASAGSTGEAPFATRSRHRRVFARALERTQAALEALAVGASPEFAAEDVRAAARALEALSGRIDVEEVLSQVFSSFCVGK